MEKEQGEILSDSSELEEEKYKRGEIEPEQKTKYEKEQGEILSDSSELEEEKYKRGEIEPEQKTKYKEGEIEIERGDIEKQLFDAAMRGDIASVKRIIYRDRYILDRVPMGDFEGKNPLHAAISTDRVACVDVLLKKQPDLAEVLDPELGVALHIASAKGHLQIVELLLKVSPAMCLAHDSHGNNPLHIAAMKDNIDVLRKLVETNPFAARVRMDKGNTILHLCVSYKKLRSLQLLLIMIRDQEFVNSVDTDGNNILHLAVLGGQIEIVALVLYNTKIDVNARNKKGWTALDIHYIVTNREDVEPVYLESNDLKDTETAETIEDLLRIDGAKRLRELFLPYQPEWQNKWQKNQNETLMIVSSLIGAMAFQVGLSPPGSVWQDNSGHEAGKSILAYRYPNWYPFLMYVNTAGFLLSLSTILLLIMALPAEGKVFGVIRSCASWLTIMATAFVYTYCITVVTPNMRQSASYAIVYLVMTWACMISLYLLKHTRQSIRSFMEERQNQKKNRERITWTRPQKQLSIKVDGREDEAGFSPNVEAGASKKIEAGGSESDEVGGSESDEAGISKEIEVAVSDEIEADRTGFDEAGITKEIEGGGSKEIEAVRSRSDKADINKKMEDGRSESEEAGGSQEIEVSGI